MDPLASCRRSLKSGGESRFLPPTPPIGFTIVRCRRMGDGVLGEMSISPKTSIDVIIIGGGISGLSAAYWLQERGRSFRLFEQGRTVGGVMRSERADGYLIEHGPNSLMTNHPDVYRLCEGVGLGTRQVEADVFANRRYLIKAKRLCPLPRSPIDFLRTPVWSGRAKLRLFAEPFIRPNRSDREESVAQFITRRFGRELLDYGFDPFVSGVYAGDPERLSMQSTFSRLVEWERQSGSVIRGALFGGRTRSPSPGAPLKRKLFSFLDGVGELPQAIGRRLGESLHLESPVTSIRPTANGWVVGAMQAGQAQEYEAQALVLATPAGATAQLLEPFAPQAGGLLQKIPYAPIAVIFLGFRRADIGHPLDGFGCLVPGREGFMLLGSLWSSTIFPGRAPEGMAALTNYLGGARRPAVLDDDDDKLVAAVMTELRPLIGLRGEPQFVRVARWPRAIPQYVIGHAARLAAVESALQKWPTLTLVGNYLRGVSVPDCITQAKQAMDRLAERLDGKQA